LLPLARVILLMRKYGSTHEACALFNVTKTIFNNTKTIFNVTKTVFNVTKTIFNVTKTTFNSAKPIIHTIEATGKILVHLSKAVHNVTQRLLSAGL